MNKYHVDQKRIEFIWHEMGRLCVPIFINSLDDIVYCFGFLALQPLHKSFILFTVSVTRNAFEKKDVKLSKRCTHKTKPSNIFNHKLLVFKSTDLYIFFMLCENNINDWFELRTFEMLAR